MVAVGSAPDAVPDDGPGDLPDRDDVLADLSDVREHARYKVFGNGRIRDVEKERIRIRYLRTLIAAANAERQTQKDRDLDAMADEIDRLRDLVEPEI